MKKYTFIGSTIAVTILIGVSFTSVVGYISVASGVKISPLFNIRTSRAIDEESEDVSFEYVGKGEEITLSLPKRENDSEIILHFIEVICKMDDTTFNRVIGIVINRLPLEININKIVSMLEQLRNDPIKLKNSDIFQKIELDKQPNTEEYTCRCGTLQHWTPGCFIEGFLLLIFVLVFWPILLIIWLNFLPTNYIPCDTVDYF